MVNVRLLELRKKMAKVRPKFLRQDYHHRMKVQDDLWRAPKGRHSKMRQNIHGHRAWVEIGYRGPVEVRGLHKSGAVFVRVETMKQLSAIDPKTSIAIMSANVGARKKYDMFKLAIEKKIIFSNINPAKFIADFDAKQKAKKDAKAATKPKSEETKKEEKKTEVKPKIEHKTEVNAKSESKTVAKKTQEDKFGA
jgi:large subunit ribosomal protein L32e